VTESSGVDLGWGEFLRFTEPSQVFFFLQKFRFSYRAIDCSNGTSLKTRGKVKIPTIVSIYISAGIAGELN